MRFCESCGAALSPLWHDGRCPACVQGVTRESAAEAFQRAEGLLRRIRAEGHPELGRLAASTRARVEQLRKEVNKRNGGERNQAAG